MTAITERQRRIMVATAAKLVSSSTPGEREVMFQRIDQELARIGMRWDEVFDRGLPLASAEQPSEDRPSILDAANAMMGGFADMMTRDRTTARPRVRHLIGEEIPRMVLGRISISEEREWRNGMMMFVEVRNDEFVYAPLVIFQERSQSLAREAISSDRPIAGMVDQPTGKGHTPVLHSLSF